MKFKEPVNVLGDDVVMDPLRLQSHLAEHGIDCEMLEPAGETGDVFAGTLAEPPPPQLIVDKTDFERARELIADLQHRLREERQRKQEALADAPPVDVECHNCGRVTQYAAILTGTVQVCPKCTAYLDVGEDEFGDLEFGEVDDET